MISNFDFHLDKLEHTAAIAMHAALTAPLSNTGNNPFLCAFAAALDCALHNKKIDPDNPPRFHGGLDKLTDDQVGQVIAVFNLFLMTFELLKLQNAVKFCHSVRSIAVGEMLARLDRQNPPSRIFPELN
jgi:hypothetical protein